MRNYIKISVAVVGLAASLITIYIFATQPSEQEVPVSIEQTGAGNTVGDGNTVTVGN